ncbi:hypothetical protein PIB30_040094 [Stylosanthes scabra]|uniref:Ribosomal protein S4 n=1 Tax=Stylosanthes scabra TaxID=79078 RepID=A0ABU6ZD65_9FABA|nr:hypothetical protein [Stylosanthes scabra]
MSQKSPLKSSTQDRTIWRVRKLNGVVGRVLKLESRPGYLQSRYSNRPRDKGNVFKFEESILSPQNRLTLVSFSYESFLSVESRITRLRSRFKTRQRQRLKFSSADNRLVKLRVDSGVTQSRLKDLESRFILSLKRNFEELASENQFTSSLNRVQP